MSAPGKRILQAVMRLILACALLIPITGCWDRVEVNDLALVMAAGIDTKTDRTIELSIQVYVPRAAATGGMGGTSNQVSKGGQTLVHSATGTTISDAMSKLQSRLPRRIFWGHNEVFIFGEAEAKKGIRSHIDFITREPQVRGNAYLFVSKQKAKDILALLPPLERDSAEVLKEMVRSDIGINVNTSKILEMMTGDAKAAAIPYIEILPPQANEQQNTTNPYITGTAVFKRDKMIGRIDDKVTRGVLWFRDELKRAIVTLIPQGEREEISMNLLRAQSKLIPSIKNGRWIITVKAKTEDDIIENGTHLDVSSPEVIDKLEKALTDDVKRKMNAALNQLQKKMNADIIGFAEAFHRKYPQQWKKAKNRWDEIFPHVEVQMDVNAAVRRPGKRTAPAGLTEDEVKKE